MSYDPTVRRFGYLEDAQRHSPLILMLERAELRPRPLNRLYPRDGHWTATCPICGAADGLFVDPGMATWAATCTRGEFTIFELHSILLTGTAP
jgi:hypothetical protein